MKKTTKGKGTDGYTDEPIGLGTVVKDFLPPPHLLVPKDDSVKVTLALSRRSVDFFKKQAKKHHVPYQRMIRALIDEYTNNVRK